MMMMMMMMRWCCIVLKNDFFFSSIFKWRLLWYGKEKFILHINIHACMNVNCRLIYYECCIFIFVQSFALSLVFITFLLCAMIYRHTVCKWKWQSRVEVIFFILYSFLNYISLFEIHYKVFFWTFFLLHHKYVIF